MKHVAAILLGLSLAPLAAGEANAWWWSDGPEEAEPAAPTPAAPTPAAPEGAARDTVPPSEIDQGTDLLKQGTELLFEGLRKEMSPALDEMRDSLGQAMTEIQPALKDLAAMLGDMRNYEAPEQLPNGDIVIRRKADAPPFKPALPDGTIVAPEGAVDL